MLITGFPAAAFGTNCYVVATGPGEECVVVDPGIEVLDQLDEVLDEHRLRPVAVLLTHGHLDHTYSVTPVCGARDIPAYIHPDDGPMLADPLGWLSPETKAMFQGRLAWSEPADVRPLADGDVVRIAGLEVTVDHAPGHTEGSVAFRLPYDDEGVPEVMLSGDLLFAGSIGRTDLPGGDTATMLDSLARKVLPLRDEVVVLPGHGPQTTIGRERATNPYLQGLPAAAADAGDVAPWLASRRCPASRSGCPSQRIVEQHVLDTLREVFELHGFASIETRSVEPLEQMLRKGEIDKEVYLLRRLQADEGTDDSGRRGSSGCTSTSPCRSPGTCSRTPGTSSSRSAATRSSGPGAGSVRRRAASASSPRPTSTSSAATPSPSTTRSRSPG